LASFSFFDLFFLAERLSIGTREGELWKVMREQDVNDGDGNPVRTSNFGSLNGVFFSVDQSYVSFSSVAGTSF
jgi:hypothetical protein